MVRRFPKKNHGCSAEYALRVNGSQIIEHSTQTIIFLRVDNTHIDSYFSIQYDSIQLKDSGLENVPGSRHRRLNQARVVPDQHQE